MWANHRYIRGDPMQNLCQFLSCHVAQIRDLWLFLYQNNHGSSGVHVACIYCGRNTKIDIRKTLHKDCGSICFAFAFVCMVGIRPPI